MAALINCYRCGKLFVRSNSDICPGCLKQVEDEYLLCNDYLKEHRQVNIYELSDETGVSVKQITQFIREGRISVSNLPNLGYPCDACGELISEGRFCTPCTDRLNKGFKSALENSPKEEDVRVNTYYQIKDRFGNK